MNDFATYETILGLVPRTAAETFGVAAMICQLVGYYLYGQHVLGGTTRPNIASWSMWFFGAIVDLVTYDSIKGSHWTTNAAPFACASGVFSVTGVIVYRHIRSVYQGVIPVYQKLERKDKFFALFDIGAAVMWLKGHGTIGNFISVGTTVFQFLPMYRETLRDPTVEKVTPWAWWSVGYALMLLAVATGPGAGSLALYFLPGYYLALHAIMVPLCLRQVGKTSRA